MEPEKMTDMNRSLLADVISRRNELRRQKADIESRLCGERDILRRLKFAYEGVKNVEEEITRWRIENIRAGGAPDAPIPKDMQKLRSQKDDYLATITASEKMIEATSSELEGVTARINDLEKGELTDRVWSVASDQADILAKQLAAVLDEYQRLSMQLWAIDTSRPDQIRHFFKAEASKIYRPSAPPVMPWQVYFNGGKPAQYGTAYKEKIKAFMHDLSETPDVEMPQ